MAELKNVGFVGIGNMGWPMAANLVRGGFAVSVFDIAPERARRFADEHQARAVTSLRELGRGAEAIVTMLPTGKEVRAALLEMEGGALAANLKPGSLVIDMSSADPVGTREIGKELAAKGIRFIDAPVSGGVPRATDGTLAIMIGGDASAVAAARPVLERMGTKLFAVGGLGCGHAMKCLNNFMAATNFAAATEAMRVGREFGLDPAVMFDVINVSTGRSFTSENVIVQHVLTGRFGSGFAVGLLAKDVKIASDLAEQIGIDNPIGRLTRDLYAEARDALGADQDHSRAAEAWDRKARRAAG
jgi:3-hydroxyisobutyrate dehydrogenase